MSRLVIPISGRMLWSTGDVLLGAEIVLLLKDSSGQLHRRPFRVDTATDVTTFPAYEARQLGIPLPQKPSPGARHAQTGLGIRSGLLRFRIDGMDPTEYIVPSFFLGDPDAPPDPRQWATYPRNFLQPFSLLDRLRFTLDKDPALGNLYGELMIEKK